MPTHLHDEGPTEGQRLQLARLLARLEPEIAADEGGGVESAVRALAGEGRTVVFAAAGPLYAARPFAPRQAPRSRGGSA